MCLDYLGVHLGDRVPPLLKQLQTRAITEQTVIRTEVCIQLTVLTPVRLLDVRCFLYLGN